MPVNACHFRGDWLRRPRAFPGTKRHEQQRENTAQQVQSVRGRKNVKETAARIRAQVNARSAKFMPGYQLSAYNPLLPAAATYRHPAQPPLTTAFLAP